MSQKVEFTDTIAKPTTPEDVKVAIKLGYRPLQGADVWVMPSSRKVTEDANKKAEPVKTAGKVEHKAKTAPIKRTMPSDCYKKAETVKKASRPPVIKAESASHTIEIVFDGKKVCTITI